MIGRLKGIIADKQEDQLLIDVGGVGYEVLASTRTLQAVNQSEAATLFIHTHVREDALQLYGFATSEEKQWFTLLSTVQGVGSRMALSLLSTLNPSELSAAIAAQDKTSLTRANGVGPKLAERIMRELKDKVAKALFAPSTGATSTISQTSAAPTALQDAVSALMNLGYNSHEATVAVQQVLSSHPAASGVEKIIPLALQELRK